MRPRCPPAPTSHPHATPHTPPGVEYKEYPEDWEQCKTMAAAPGTGSVNATAEDLNPCSTYCIRLVAIGDGGETAGPEAIIDTQAPDCTPKADKKKCVIS